MPETSWSEYLIVLVIFLFMIGMVLLFVFSPWKSIGRKAQKPPEGPAEKSKESKG